MGRPYTLKIPESGQSCVVFSSPHSGSEYPSAFLASSRLDSLAIRSSEDAFVDELFMDAPNYGAYILMAHAPRAYIDLNRRADELDPAIVKGAQRPANNPRVEAGLGVIPRVVGNARAIRTGKITLAEAKNRITDYYDPFHECLQDVLTKQKAAHGMSILFDCHSMPQRALENAPLVRGGRPDIVLGDRFGASSDRWILDAAEKAFEAAGFRVARNAPFSGGYITQNYGQPSRAAHAIQIEVNRALYMDEARIAKRPEFAQIREVFSRITSDLAKLGPTRSTLAAE